MDKSIKNAAILANLSALRVTLAGAPERAADAENAIKLTDEAGAEHHFEDEPPPDLIEALRVLIEKADDLMAAIEGATDQFDEEVAALSKASSAAEKALRAAGGGA